MQKFKLTKKEDIKKLPKTPGVYALKDKTQFLYIGKAANIKKRVKNHFSQPTFRDNLFLKNIKKVGYIKTDSEIEALILEAKLIKKHSPLFNILWKDDKKYFFVAQTKEEFPRIFITHQPKQTSKQKIRYVGPFVEGKALKETLKTLRRVFPYRSCARLPKKPCLWYQLDRCPAPCLLKSRLGEQIPIAKTNLKKECQQNTKNIIKILEGKKQGVVKNLKKRMTSFSKKQDYKNAAKTKRQLEALGKILAHARVLQSLRPTGDKDWSQTQKELKKLFAINIERIEAYDISNIQGAQASGSMVVFKKGIPDKNSYRKFKIKSTEQPNDVAMIKEVLQRRLKHPEWPYPQLILIDGGKAQLNAAKEALDKSGLNKKVNLIKLASLAKKENKLFLENKRMPIKLSSLAQSLEFLILFARDEAHRFAQKYHHKLREIDLRPKS